MEGVTKSFIKYMAILKTRKTQTADSNKTIQVLEPQTVKVNTDIPIHMRQADFLQLFYNNNGLILKSCEQLHIKYGTYQNWLKDPKFKARFDMYQQKVNEIMENSLIQKALTTNSPVPEIFYLKSRDPRYSQRVTLEGDDDKPIQITYNKDILNTISKSISNILSKE